MATVRTVLVIARTVPTLTRLLDVLSLLHSDYRIQVKFTHDPENPAHFNAGTRELLDSLEADVVSWNEVTTKHFDLALAASENDRLHELSAPVFLFPHGIGYQKYYPGSTTVAGMDPRRLLHRGRVVPSVIALSHHRQRREIEESHAEAVSRTVVVGDPCLDRLLESRHLGPEYHTALGAEDTSLVVLASTWGHHSLFGSAPDLPERLLQELPTDEYRVALVLHPGIWSRHSPWQVRAWLTKARQSGLHIIPPQEGWRAALVAASCVLTDEGSLALYAAALDKPLLLAGTPSPTTVIGSPLASLAATAGELRPNEPLRSQIDESIRQHEHGQYRWIVDRAVEYRGASARLTRRALYQALELSEPPDEAVFPPVPAPSATRSPVRAFVAGGIAEAEGVTLTRYPVATMGQPAHERLDNRHLVADVRHAERIHLESASILCTQIIRACRRRFGELAESLFTRWPHAELVAAAVDHWTCLVGFRDGRTVAVTVRRSPIRLDPLVLASHLYVRIRADGRTSEHDRLHLGGCLVEVAVTGVEAGRVR